jgi:hypothetical protein
MVLRVQQKADEALRRREGRSRRQGEEDVPRPIAFLIAEFKRRHRTSFRDPAIICIVVEP